MKLFNKRKFRTMIFLGFLLLAVAGAGMYLSASSFLAAVAHHWVADNKLAEAVGAFWIMFGVSVLAACVVILSALALLRREIIVRRKDETKLSRLQQAAEESEDLITIMTPNGRIEYANKAVEQLTGFTRPELIGKRHKPWFPWYADIQAFRKAKDTVLSGLPFHAVVSCRKKDGGIFTIQEHIKLLEGVGGFGARMISTARDITREKNLEERLDFLDWNDPLTGLPNRQSAVRMLEQSVAEAAKKNAELAVLIIDINRLKHVNDLFGTAVGDEVLIRTSKRLRTAVGNRDIVARLGSDEFIVIHFEGAKTADAATVAENIRADVSQNITLDKHDIVVTATMGVAAFPDNGTDAWTLLKNADLALVKAKAHGRNAIQFFDEGITKRISEFFFIERRLFSALQNDEYLLHYQPYCDLVTRKVSGAEALIKWKNPDLGVVSPSTFIPSLEDTGMIIDVGRWVLETACSQIKKWERKDRAFSVSVNLSQVQFRHKDLVDMVSGTIRGFRLDPRRVTLEVTETVFMHDMELAIGILQQLKDVGVSLSVDDFGTGYSSLSYIKRLPVDNLKIDMSFVRDVTRDQDAASIITAITALARSLNLKTIAEGVETEEQRKILHLLRCDMGQGFLFSPAVPAEEFENMLDLTLGKQDSTD